MIALVQLNKLPTEQFVEQLSGIFEHSPWVAQRAATARPFSSRLQLHDMMRSVVEAASHEEQLRLINAHPKLGAGSRQQLTPSSASEQRRAGLDACSAEEVARLQELNDAYARKFGFPFILAVRGHDPQSIIANCERRLRQLHSQEIRTALDQIGLIAGYRLEALIDETPAAT
jgi:2-oxo-4-hydroxy-4-carboxy-5-ureidoimidazoline decarboxylase